jgi:hypothetical protein
MTNDEVEVFFKNDTKNHIMEIINDNGELSRHIRFSNKGSNIHKYSLITWPGYLLITGDMGTYVFKRLTDMFDFFDTNLKSCKINPAYWAEKLEAINSNCGSDASITEHNSELFQSRIKETFDEWVVDNNINNEEKNDVWIDINESILSYTEDEYLAYNAVYEFDHNNLNFYDMDFDGCKTYKYQYIWILYAIVAGIKQYKESLDK